MEGETWARIREYLATALELDTAERGRYLDELAVEDAGAAIEVAELLFENLNDASSSAILEWKQIGGYDVLREIGRGGSSIVFAARKEGLERTVALKLLLREVAGPPGSDEFWREQRALSQIRHPGIVGLLDGGRTEGGLAYLVLEWIDGRPIDVYCRESCGSTREVAELFARLCDVVAAAHEKGFVHRDIKPGNVLVEAGGVPRLLDFGVAKMLSAKGGTTVAGMTLGYASPEQVQGGPIGPASDVYSLGVLGHLLFTGESPYQMEEANLLALSRAICEGRWEPPRMFRIGGRIYPADRRLNQILGKCMRADPGDRYATAREAEDDLRRWLAGKALLRANSWFWWRVQRGWAGYRVELLTAAAMVAVIAALLAAAHGRGEEAARLAMAETAASKYRAETQRLIHENLDEIQAGVTRDEPIPAARREFLTETMMSLHTLRASGEDARLLYDLGVAYTLMSRLPATQRPEIEEALRQTLRAQECFYRLHEAAPENTGYVLALSRNYVRMAELFQAQGDGNGAFAAYREAGAYLRELPRPERNEQLLAAIERREAAGHLRLALEAKAESNRTDPLSEAVVLLFVADAEVRNGLMEDARRSFETAEGIVRRMQPEGRPGEGGPEPGDLPGRIMLLREIVSRRMAVRAGWE